MEVLFVIWLVFVIKYPSYRPRWSYITFGLGAFFVFMIISCFTGVDFNLSMWGDVERMLGAFHVFHFFLFYLIIITVFREWEDWRNLFIVALSISFFIAIDSINTKSYSTIGNVAYVAGLMIFAAYYSLLLFSKTSNKKIGTLWIALVFIYIYETYNARVAGAYSGFVIGLGMAVFLYGILTKNKKIRYSTIFIFIFGVVFSFYFFAIDNNILTRNFAPLRDIRDELSLSKPTFQTRLISWRAGLVDLKEHPLLGVGHGNYALIFDKYFDPKFYNYTRGETYFDRAHNNLIDIVSTTGILGLLAYLSIFAAVGYYLIVGYRKNKINIHEFIIISSLLTAYFVQNLAVFDSFITYQMLMITLGYVYWLQIKGEEASLGATANNTRSNNFTSKDQYFEDKETYIFVFVGILMLFVIYQYNIKPWKMLVGTIDGQRVAQNKQQMIETYRDKALIYNTILDRDSRTSLIRAFSDPSDFNAIKPEKRAEYADYLIDLAEKNVDYNPKDSLNQMTLAQILSTVSQLYVGDAEKFSHYSNRAIEAIDKSIEASPRRVPIYYQKAQIQMTRGENEAAVETLRYAYDLNPVYYDSACYLGKTLIFQKEEAEGYKYLGECIDLGGASLLAPANYVKSLINKYVEDKDWQRVIKLYVRLTQMESADFGHWINLAKLYKQEGDIVNAKSAVESAIKINPALKEYADEFIANLEN